MIRGVRRARDSPRESRDHTLRISHLQRGCNPVEQDVVYGLIFRVAINKCRP
jgi:hypothetical protein